MPISPRSLILKKGLETTVLLLILLSVKETQTVILFLIISNFFRFLRVNDRKKKQSDEDRQAYISASPHASSVIAQAKAEA